MNYQLVVVPAIRDNSTILLVILIATLNRIYFVYQA